MKESARRSIDLIESVRILRGSRAFRESTRLVRLRVALTALALFLGTLTGLFAIDSQSRLLASLGQTTQSQNIHLFTLLAIFFTAQFLFEALQWLRRSLQNRVSVAITVALRKMIYQKFSSLTYAELQLVSPGEVAQLHASDSSQLAGVWAEGLLAFLTTLMLTLGVSIFLTIQVGIPGSIFFLVLLILIFLAQRFARQMSPALQKRAIFSSQRLSVLQESIRSVFLVKALNAEKEFTHRIGEFTALEQDMKLLSNQISCRYVPIFASLRWVAWAALLLWVVYAPLLTNQAFAPAALVALVFAVNWFSSLLQDSFLFVGTYLSFIQVGAVSAQRLDAFLNKPFNPPVFINPHQSLTPEAEIALENVSVEYPSRPGQMALQGVSVSVRKGQLVAILGPVGSGKSTLLRTFLGELKPSQGSVVRDQDLRVGYLSQDVVLPSATLRDVLRFEFDNLDSEDPTLRGLLQHAEFSQDLETMPAGLGTPIGERGVTLSGGQRLRVGLAQLSYFENADVLLLDDPLAALDATTSEALVSSLICGLWSNKTRIVCTHQPDLARRADWVVRMENGRIVEQGPPDQVGLSQAPL